MTIVDIHAALAELLAVRKVRVHISHPTLADFGDLVRYPLPGVQVTLVPGGVGLVERVDVAYTATAPCRLAQLQDAVVVSGGRGGGQGSGGSRPLVAANALDLWRDIATAAGMWAVAVGVDRSRYLKPTRVPAPRLPLAGGAGLMPAWWQQVNADEESIFHDPDEVIVAAHRRAQAAKRVPREEVEVADVRPFATVDTPPVGRLLRAAATEADRRGYVAMVDTMIRLADRWAGQIDAVLGSPNDRSIRGVACPDCDAGTVVEERDGERWHSPALVLSYGWDDRERRPYRWCRACGSWAWLDIEESEAA